ncbi:low affinity immunoglobulin epsilon Fc receptor-like [Drosophila eugracilis]|uniref:low affinity immunoglobulin epsilon Fc receptor-like n=1 Tax=Drosophila eugracilis TaxID=29029 RepID=UPI0007E5D623|nr:low affinity immunoglobulin epsilon Fc receptor-like [Drosophila eugracilis]
MRTPTSFLVCCCIFFKVLGSLAYSEESDQSICVLSDPPKQCGQFCSRKLHPMLNLIPDTVIKLDKIQGEQQAIHTRLQAVQFWLQVQWTLIKGSLKEISPEVFEARLNETEAQLLALNSDIKKEFKSFQLTMEGQFNAKLLEVQTMLDDQKISLQESCRNTIKQKDFEVMLNRTVLELGSQLKLVDTELKRPLWLLENKVDSQLLEVSSGLEREFLKVNTKLDNQQTGIQVSLKSIVKKEEEFEAKLQLLQSKMDAQERDFRKILARIDSKIIPPQFQQIDKRFFYIGNETKLDWSTAAATCRKIGGYLASIKDQKELDAIQPKLGFITYWLGTNDQKTEGQFISEASGKRPFLKWRSGEPNNYGGNENCVDLNRGTMNDASCSNIAYFICQADKEI